MEEIWSTRPLLETLSERIFLQTMDAIRVSVVTISDKGYAGQREDVSGPLLARLLRDMGTDVVHQTIVPDEPDEIIRVLVALADAASDVVSQESPPGELGSEKLASDRATLDLILTTGGTGVTPRDVTPEATKSIIEREMPGLAEALRFTGYNKTPLAVISRGVAGIRGRTLIINLPGSPNAVRDGMETLAPILPHVIRMIRGRDTEHDYEEES